MADSEANPLKPPTIIMKVDAPVEENTKEENEENENTETVGSIKPSQICSPVAKPILLQSRLGSNPFATNTFSTSILRPSQLGVRSSSGNLGTTKGTFSLNPSRLNPLSKTPTEDTSDNNETNKKQNLPHANGDTPKFVPLLLTDKKTSESPVKPVTVNTTNLSGSNNFVFGQNLQDRVLADSKSDDPKPSTSCLNSNGTTEMLFSSAIKDKPKTEVASSVNKETKSLSESAREYEESRASKRKYEEVEVKTGEEEETNVMQISCKLFSFDKSSGSWQERGRGNLRLNDLEVASDNSMVTQSRLVFRTSGSLRVILNTKIWGEMTIDLASSKSIRLTALDSNGEIKVFLIMGNQDETIKLYNLLEERLSKVKNKLPHVHTKKIATDSGGK